MKHAVIALVVALGLSGCDEASKELGSAVTKTMEDKNKSHQMTLVIHSGYSMIVGGQPAKVYGAEECPPADQLMKLFFGPDPDEGAKTCVVIAPDTKTVTVTVGLPSGASKESWAVERKDDRVMLRRADGTLLAASE